MDAQLRSQAETVQQVKQENEMTTKSYKQQIEKLQQNNTEQVKETYILSLDTDFQSPVFESGISS